MVSDISESDASVKGGLHGVNLLDVSNGIASPNGSKVNPSEEINRYIIITVIDIIDIIIF